MKNRSLFLLIVFYFTIADGSYVEVEDYALSRDIKNLVHVVDYFCKKQTPISESLIKSALPNYFQERKDIGDDGYIYNISSKFSVVCGESIFLEKSTRIVLIGNYLVEGVSAEGVSQRFYHIGVKSGPFAFALKISQKRLNEIIQGKHASIQSIVPSRYISSENLLDKKVVTKNNKQDNGYESRLNIESETESPNGLDSGISKLSSNEVPTRSKSFYFLKYVLLCITAGCVLILFKVLANKLRDFRR